MPSTLGLSYRIILAGIGNYAKEALLMPLAGLQSRANVPLSTRGVAQGQKVWLNSSVADRVCVRCNIRPVPLLRDPSTIV
jgi:hypothetical protein